MLCCAAAYGQTAVSGCAAYCTGRVQQSICKEKCQQVVAQQQAFELPLEEQASLRFELEMLTELHTETEITGSDMYAKKISGKLFFTTRDGGVYRFIPRPKEDGRVVEQVYKMPASMKLDTSADKGLYDIAFTPRFNNTRLLYLVYAATCESEDGENCDHVLSVAEYFMERENNIYENITFQTIVERLPQFVPYRSGGFMKMSADASSKLPTELWISSGGNQDHDRAKLQSQPKYSSIYGITPHNYKEVHRQHRAWSMWGNGLNNPFECDFHARTRASNIICLTRQYNEFDEPLSVSLGQIEPGHTFDETTAHIVNTHGYYRTDKPHSWNQVFDYETTCPPETVIFSGKNLLGLGYENRIFVARPPCAVEEFKQSQLQILARNSSAREWHMAKVPLDFGKLNLWRMQLMGAERSHGLFLAGRDLATNKYGIYLVKKKPGIGLLE